MADGGTLKPGWRKWRFDQIATSVNERIDNPSESDFEYYVGLEHIDPDSLKLRRWGSPSDVEATKLIFRKGDIIFGRRRVYQRKVAVAEFDGICSAHALVLRANPEVVLPDFLPFFMQSDLFMERAKSISVGSLSPTINWKTLAKEEFLIPPLEEQLRIKVLMSSVENTLVCHQKSRFFGENLFKSILENLLDPAEQGWKTKKIGNSFKVSCGGTPKRNKPEYWDGEIPWIKTGEVNFNSINGTEEHITQAGLENSSAKLAPINSVIMALFGQGPTLGRVAILDIEATTNQACAIIHPEEDYNMRFVYYSLWRQYERVRAKARGASQPNINASIVKGLEVPCISIEEQNSWVNKLDDQLSAMRSIDERIESAARLKKRMLNKLFG